MEKVIETCLDFHPSNSLGCLGIIAKIEERVLEMTNSTNNVILIFKTLLKLKNSKPVETQPTYPPFSACIHCESSLAAILCQLHGNWILSLNASLLKLFQASPFLHSSSLPDLWYRSGTSPTQWCITFPCQSSVVLSVGSSLRSSTRQTIMSNSQPMHVHHSNLYTVCLPPFSVWRLGQLTGN